MGLVLQQPRGREGAQFGFLFQIPRQYAPQSRVPELANGGPGNVFHKKGFCDSEKPCFGILGQAVFCRLHKVLKDRVDHVAAQARIGIGAERVDGFEAQDAFCIDRIRVADQPLDLGHGKLR